MGICDQSDGGAADARMATADAAAIVANTNRESVLLMCLLLLPAPCKLLGVHSNGKRSKL
jgi:hypothetical protein